MLAPPAASLPNEKRVLAHASLPLQYTPDTAAGLDYIFLAIAFHLYGPAHYIFLEITFHPGHSYTGSSEKKGKAFILKEQS